MDEHVKNAEVKNETGMGHQKAAARYPRNCSPVRVT